MAKLRAIEVQCADGTIITVHEPRFQDLGTFVRTTPYLERLGAALRAVGKTDGVVGVPVEFTDDMLEGIYPLFAIMCSISVDEFKDLPLFDGLGVLSAFNEFAPKKVPTDSTV